ncbi:MAG: hypothetical protein WKG07_46885 [Hymenobacter sp.]
MHHRAHVAVPWGLLGRLSLAFGLLCAVWYGLQHLLALPWLLESALATAAFAGISMALGLVPLAEIWAFIRPAKA